MVGRFAVRSLVIAAFTILLPIAALSQDTIVKLRDSAGDLPPGIAVALDRVPAHVAPKLLREKGRSIRATMFSQRERGHPLSRVYVVEGLDAADIAALNADPLVEYAEPDTVFSIADTFWDQPAPWNSSIDALYGVKATEAHLVWDQAQGDGVVVAVIDTGINPEHEDLRDRVVPGWNFINNTPDPYDGHGHGTHVAGTIAATWNDVGVRGVAPLAKIMPMKGLTDAGSGATSGLAQCVIWAAEHGAHVTNNSWGGSSCDISGTTLANAFAYASSLDVLHFAAAGNANSDVACFFPANLPNVQAVSAIDWNYSKASFSNWGDEVMFALPGVAILSTLHQDSALGRNRTPIGGSGTNAYYLLNGTSMACPHAAGIGAMLRSWQPAMTAQQVVDLMVASSIDYGDVGRDPIYGYGVPSLYFAIAKGGEVPLVGISEPRAFSFVHGDVVTVRGFTDWADLESWSLWWASETAPQTKTLIAGGTHRVSGGVLGEWVIAGLPDAAYRLTLAAVGSDGREFVRINGNVRVDNVNQPPVLTRKPEPVERAYIGPRGELPSFVRFEWRDPDDPDTPAGAVQVQFEGLPQGATYDAAAGVIRWKAQPGQHGSYPVTAILSDSGHVVRHDWRWDTTLVERFPVAEGPAFNATPKTGAGWVLYTSDETGVNQVHGYEIATGRREQMTAGVPHSMRSMTRGGEALFGGSEWIYADVTTGERVVLGAMGWNDAAVSQRHVAATHLGSLYLRTVDTGGQVLLDPNDENGVASGPQFDWPFVVYWKTITGTSNNLHAINVETGEKRSLLLSFVSGNPAPFALKDGVATVGASNVNSYDLVAGTSRFHLVDTEVGVKNFAEMDADATRMVFVQLSGSTLEPPWRNLHVMDKVTGRAQPLLMDTVLQAGSPPSIDGNTVAYLHNGTFLENTNNGDVWYLRLYDWPEVPGGGEPPPPPPPPDPEPNTLHVAAIWLSVVNAGGGNKVGIADVQIVDAGGLPVAGATVRGSFVGDFSGERIGVTGSNGMARLEIGPVRGRTKFEFCVESVELDGWEYRPGENKVECVAN